MGNGFFRRRVRRTFEDNDSAQDEFNKEFRHSTYYHRYFQNYSEVRIARKNGKGHAIRRTYVGDYYRRDCTDGQWFFVKLAYLLLYLLTAGCFAVPYSLPLAGNRGAAVEIFVFLTTLILVFYLYCILSCLIARRNMTVYDYSCGFLRLPLINTVATAFLLLCAVSTVITLCVRREAASLQNWLPVLGSGLGAGFLTLSSLIEVRAGYLRIPSGVTPERDSITIS